MPTVLLSEAIANNIAQYTFVAKSYGNLMIKPWISPQEIEEVTDFRNGNLDMWMKRRGRRKGEKVEEKEVDEGGGDDDGVCDDDVDDAADLI
ncbi:Hypothetical predicted protein [Octopus vulgaris]|uniref:Uncharacterized protein n=1 Tax=Octopus vulgaris TaxID=6645 RepID=A0AA36BRG5_OCTVU|nr:Hypothetical predicted protein [Octopus vulgaris]